MPEKANQALSDVSKTLLLPLYNRAMESQRPDAMIKDEKGVALVAQLMADEPTRYDFSRVRQLRITELMKVIRIILTREIDRYAREFLRRNPEAVVVHIGCGLDTRFERVDDGRVEWYDLDLPEVIDLRRKYIGVEGPALSSPEHSSSVEGPALSSPEHSSSGEGERYHLLSYSVLEDAWLEAVPASSPVLFLAEAVFIFFSEAQVRSLVLRLRDHFPGAELVCDGWKPFEIWLGNRYLSRSQFTGLMQWGVWSGREIERWGDPSTSLPSTSLPSTSLRAGGIHLLDAWGFFDQPEPRLNSYRWMAPLFRLFKPIRIFHFQLGKAAE